MSVLPNFLSRLFHTPLKLSHKLLLTNIGVIFALTLIFLGLNYFSNKTLLSRVMNGIDEKVLVSLAENLEGYYRENQSWDGYLNNQALWENTANATFFKIFLSLMPQPLPPPPPSAEGAKPCDPPFGTFFQRLSLLDKDKEVIIPAELPKEDSNYHSIKHKGKVVGWISVGKINVDLLPLAPEFFEEQLKISTWACILGGIIAAILSVYLSRKITQPIQRLIWASGQIAQRKFNLNVNVNTRDELQDLAQSFNDIARELERFETRQKQWIMDMAHELRTPLTILVGEIAAIRDGVSAGDDAAIKSLQEEVMRIRRLIDDMNDLSTIDNPGFRFAKKVIDLQALIKNQLAIYRDKFNQQSITLHEILCRSALVYADDDRITQVIRNLLENSLRYTNHPGELWLRCYRESGKVTVIVEDSGPGVSEEALNRIFDRLYRTDSSRSRITGGAGLGLTICKKIISAHGGEITASKSEKGGLCIRFTLPESELDSE